MIFARDTPLNNLWAQIDPMKIGFIIRLYYGTQIRQSSRTSYRLYSAIFNGFRRMIFSFNVCTVNCTISSAFCNVYIVDV